MMAGFGFRKNMAFEWNGAKFRIDRLQPNGELLLERIDNGQISIVTKAELLAEYSNGNIAATTIDDATLSLLKPTYGRPLDELSVAVQNEVKRRGHYLQYILDQGKPVFTSRYLRPLIKVAAEVIGDTAPPSVTSIYRWHRRYQASGDTRALIPRTDLRGASQARQNDRVLHLLSEAIEEAYKTSPLATGQTIYTRLVAKIDAENRQTLGGESLKPPSTRTLYRLLRRTEVYETVRLREGKAIADKRFRLVRVGTRTQNILERAEIDHTPLDLFLIDEKTWLPLGRPTLTVVIDHYSRMLLGYYLSFGDPSAAAVMGALRDAILPKTLTAGAIPNLKTENVWPCYGRLDVLVVDNGLEFHGIDLEAVAFDLGMRIQFCPKHRPQFKGVVERYLKTINYFFSHQLPGTSFSRLHQRGDYDPQKQALLTLAEFKQLFEKWVVDVYAQTPHRGIGTTPWAKWHEGLQRREPELPDDLRTLQRRIGLVSERTLRQDGITLRGIRYNGDELGPILRAYGAGVKVRVLYDPEDLGEIQVWGPDDAEPVAVLALDQGYANSLTERQNEIVRAHLRERGATVENKVALQGARAEIARAVEELMASRKQRDRRRAAAIRGMSSNRPERDLKQPPKVLALPKPKKRAKQASSDDKPELPECLPSFTLKRTSGKKS
ncbi:MAG: Mu transposase C-terminal domain-containing protein [Thiobacillus sp.]